MSKKASDQDAYDVSPAVKKAALKLLDELTKDLEAASRSVEKGARLSDDAIGTFRRRYRLSLQRVRQILCETRHHIRKALEEQVP